MTKYAIFDTETSGLPDFKKPADAPGQPRLASFSMILTDDEGQIVDRFDALVKPNGWTISPEITAINGLTTEKCAEHGMPVAEVLDAYTAAIKAGYVVVAYNAQFDAKIMRGELRLAERPDLFEETKNICVMRACHDGYDIQKAGAKKGGFPKLSDAYMHFFQTENPNGHTAAGDALACYDIFMRLRADNALPEPQVHYAKNKPEAAAA